MPSHRWMFRLGLVALVTLAAGCGSGSGDEGAAAPTTTAGASAGGDGLERARADVATLSKAPTSIGVTEPLAERPTGKTVVYLECSVVNCKQHATDLKAAFDKLGVTFKSINSGLSPETFQNAFDIAIQEQPDGVIYDAVPAAIAQKNVDKLAAAGIPVVGIASPDLKPGPKVFVVEGPEFFRRMGRGLANWAIADSGGKANVVYLSDPTLAFGDSESSELTATFAANCPDCEVDKLQTSSAEIGKELPGKVSSYLQSHPETDYVIAQYSALLIGVPAALKTVGLTGVKLAGFAPTQINQGYLKAGEEAAEIMHSNGAQPWTAADVMARALVGQEVDLRNAADPPLVQLLTPDDVTWDPQKEDWPYLDGWQQKFEELWAGP